MIMGMFKVTYVNRELTFRVEKLKLTGKLNKTYQSRKHVINHDETVGVKNRDVL